MVAPDGEPGGDPVNTQKKAGPSPRFFRKRFSAALMPLRRFPDRHQRLTGIFFGLADSTLGISIRSTPSL